MQGALRRRAAAEYIDVNPRSLDTLPIPFSDLRKPGKSRPVKRWRVADLDAYLADTLVSPGQPNKQVTR